MTLKPSITLTFLLYHVSGDGNEHVAAVFSVPAGVDT